MPSLFCLFIKNKINKTQKHCRRVSLSLMLSFIFPLFKPFLLLFCLLFWGKTPPFPSPSHPILLYCQESCSCDSPAFFSAIRFLFLCLPLRLSSPFFVYLKQKQNIFETTFKIYSIIFRQNRQQNLYLHSNSPVCCSPLFSACFVFDIKITGTRHKMITFDKILSITLR